MVAATRHRAAFADFVNIVGYEWGDLLHWGYGWLHSYEPGCQDVAPAYIIRDPLPKWLTTNESFPDCHLTNQGATMSSYRRLKTNNTDTTMK